jgi:hypothetical protein
MQVFTCMSNDLKKHLRFDSFRRSGSSIHPAMKLGRIEWCYLPQKVNRQYVDIGFYGKLNCN